MNSCDIFCQTFGAINWWWFAAATVVAFVVGAVWFSWFFAKA
jgi:hypothetical protein